jgi:hypothetical protein
MRTVPDRVAESGDLFEGALSGGSELPPLDE